MVAIDGLIATTNLTLLNEQHARTFAQPTVVLLVLVGQAFRSGLGSKQGRVDMPCNSSRYSVSGQHEAVQGYLDHVVQPLEAYGATVKVMMTFPACSHIKDNRQQFAQRLIHKLKGSACRSNPHASVPPSRPCSHARTDQKAPSVHISQVVWASGHRRASGGVAEFVARLVRGLQPGHVPPYVWPCVAVFGHVTV